MAVNFRIQAAGQVLRGLAVGSVLDVGCRTCEARDVIPAGAKYFGNDLFQNDAGTVTYVGDVNALELDMAFDCVLALDIVEHVDDPHSLMEKLLTFTDKHLIVSLPNTYDLLHKYEFVVKSSLGKKYAFGVENSLDRHRWVMNCDEIQRFYSHFAAKHRLSLVTRPLMLGENSPNIGTRLACTALGYCCGRNVMTRTIMGVFSKQ